MTASMRERGGRPEPPPEAWRPPNAPVPDRPLTEWNPIAARYVAQLYRYVQQTYGPAADVAGIPVFLVDPGGPGVLLLARVTGPAEVVVVGTGARPSALELAPHGPTHDSLRKAEYHLRRLAPELAAAYGYRPPVPWETKY
jgi:hypothetical protein